MPALGKMMRAVASMASPATTAKKWKRVERIFSPSYVTRRLIIPRVGSDWQPLAVHRDDVGAIVTRSTVDGDDAMSAWACDQAALLGSLGLHGRFNFVSEAAEVIVQPAVHFPLGLIGRQIAD
jgi:hypothetical protein